MSNRWMAVPGTAVAKGDHGKGHAKKEKAAHHKSAKKHAKKDKASKKAKKPKNFVFRGVYKGDGVVTVVSGVTAADVQAGDAVLVQARLPRGSKAPEPAEVKAPEGPAAESAGDDAPVEEAPAAIKARKLIDYT